MTFLLLSIFILLCLSFIFNVAEMTYLNLDRAEYAALQQRDPGQAHLVQDLISSPALLFTTLLIGIHATLTTANILYSHLVISLPISARTRDLLLLIYTILVILFAEALPQVIGIRNASRIYLPLARPLRTFVFLVRPLTIFSEFLFRRFHRQKPRPFLEREIWRPEDLLRVASSASQTVSSAISRFIASRTAPVASVMRPAAQTVYLAEEDSLQNVFNKFAASGFSRLPYWKSGSTRFFAYLHLKDALRLLSEESSDWKRYLRPLPVFLPTTPILKAFLSLRALKAHIAAIATPDGKIAGIITMEDLLTFFIAEELVSPKPTLAEVSPANP
jgi:putative hemolysin